MSCPSAPAASAAAATAGPAAGRPTQARQQLEVLRARIGDLTERLAQELRQRDQLAARMRDADLAIPDRRKALDAVQLERRAADKRRDELLLEQRRTGESLDRQRDELGRQLRAAYMLGREQQWKLLLNQENPAQAGRMLTYYGYFGRRQLAQIQSIEEELSRLDSIGRDLAAQSTKLDRLDVDARRELQGLLAARGERAAALAALTQRVQSRNLQIAQLREEENALNALLANLRRAAPDFSLGPQKPFARMQGTLPWPVTGRLLARFHQPRGDASDNSLRWSGVLIDAPRSAKIRAPYHGRVIYADWLQGLGLLLIIEHGAGYLTLYGHCEVLYKGVGDSVAPGDIIAGLGDADAASLYFEIRQGKTPLDPQRWLRAAR